MARTRVLNSKPAANGRAAWQPEDPASLDGEVLALRKVADYWREERRGEGDSMLHTIIQHMKDAVVLADRDRRVLAANESGLELIGDHAGPAGEGKTVSLGCLDPSYARCMRGETVENLVQEHEANGGRHFYILNGAPIRNARGEIEMALVVARDITELHKLQNHTERMLAEISRQRASLKHLINNMPAGVVLLDSELRVLGGNKAYARYLDREKPWRVGARLADLLPKAEESGILPILRRALKRRRPVRAHDFRYDGFGSGITYWSGSAVPIEMPTEHGPIAAIALVVVDVTEEVSARDRLAELAAVAERRADDLEAERTRLNTIIQWTPIPLIVYDADWSIVTHNRAATKLMKALGVNDGFFSASDVGPERGLVMFGPDGKQVSAGNGPYSRSRRGQVMGDVVITCKSPTGCTRTLSFSAAPLKDASGQITGVVQAIHDITDDVRSQEQLREVYRREHAIAEKLQRCFLPSDLPRIQGFEIAERYRPALDEALVGGDFYDVFRIGEDHYGVVIGDVAGKGLRAAVYTAMTKYMLRAYALEESAPELVLARLNEALAACTPAEVFVTLVYAILDARNKTFVYANAGHEQPIYFSSDEGFVTTLDVTGRALALAKGSSYTAHTLEMRPKDAVILYTDGITDAGWGVNRLGQEGLLRLVESGVAGPVAEFAESVMNAALEYTGGDLADDAALLIIRTIDEG